MPAVRFKPNFKLNPVSVLCRVLPHARVRADRAAPGAGGCRDTGSYRDIGGYRDPLPSSPAWWRGRGRGGPRPPSPAGPSRAPNGRAVRTRRAAPHWAPRVTRGGAAPPQGRRGGSQRPAPLHELRIC